jgi:hypothetical protein
VSRPKWALLDLLGAWLKKLCKRFSPGLMHNLGD